MQSLADKLNKLFEVAHRASEPAISTAAAAEEITCRSGIPISQDHLEQLRAGTTQDASMQQLSAIAEFFGVSAGYLTDPLGDPMVGAQLNLLQAMRDSGVRDLRSCGAATPASERPTPQAINRLAETIKRISRGSSEPQHSP